MTAVLWIVSGQFFRISADFSCAVRGAVVAAGEVKKKNEEEISLRDLRSLAERDGRKGGKKRQKSSRSVVMCEKIFDFWPQP